MPKNKKGGVVTSTIMGIGGLIIGVIIILVITSTLNNANLIANDSVTTTNVANESVTFGATNVAQTLDASGYATADSSISCGAITFIHNETITGALLGLTNVTQTDCRVINATALEDFIGNGTIYVSYPYTTTTFYTKNAVGNLSTNFTAGIGNVSSKIPTILLIVAVVFLFGALVLLIRNAQAMGIGGRGEGSL